VIKQADYTKTTRNVKISCSFIIYRINEKSHLDIYKLWL